MASLRPQQFLNHPQQSEPFRFMNLDLYSNNMEGHISQPVTYFSNPNPIGHHPPYFPLFDVGESSLGPINEETGFDLQRDFEIESQNKRLKEQDFLESNSNYGRNCDDSQISFVDFLQTQSVSTGLVLSLPNNLVASSELPLIGLVGDDIERELQIQDAEIDKYIKLQGDRLREEITQKVQTIQLQTISYIKQKLSHKLREKDAAIRSMNQKNTEFQMQIEHLSLEVNSWQQRAQYNENTINSLRLNLQQVHNQNRWNKEGCGDSGIVDTASCFNGRQVMKEMMACKVCNVNEICMLLLPCKHLCLCQDCDSKLSACPLCHTSKYTSFEVYM